MKTLEIIAGALCLVLAILAFALDMDFLQYSPGGIQVNIYAGFALLLAGIVLLFVALWPART